MSDFKGKSIRRVNVSKQRKISIPQDFYNALNLDDEALMEFTGESIVIRPTAFEEVDFSEDILRDLIKQRYAGEALVKEFMNIKSNIPRAMDSMKEEAMKQPVMSESLDDYFDSLEYEDDE